MTIDFAGLLDAPAYATFGVEATITPVGQAGKTLTVLDQPIEVEDESAAGVLVPSVAPGIRLRLSELAEQGLARADLEKAEVVLGDDLYVVLATRPARNRRELELILTERS